MGHSTAQEAFATPVSPDDYVDVEPADDTNLDHSLEMQLTNYRALVKRANDVLGSAELATRWLSSPNPSLDGDIPLQLMGRENYSREAIEKYLEPIFRRIEFGIYA